MVDSTNSFVSCFGTAAGLIGASAWFAPYVYRILSKPTIKAKIISELVSPDFANGKFGLRHFVALNIISLNKCFNLKEIKVSISYPNNKEKYTGKLFYEEGGRWTIKKNIPLAMESKQKEMILSITPKKYLLYTGTIPKEKSVILYLTFRVCKEKLSDFDDLTITFIEHSGRKCSVTTKHSDIEEDQMLFDNKIWGRANT